MPFTTATSMRRSAAFVTALGRACDARGLPLRGTPKTSIFRIHRDVRFAKDKRPYKTHAGAVLTRSGQKSDPGLFYIHIAPEGCFCAAGFYDLSPVRLHALRAAMAGEPARFLAMARKARGGRPRPRSAMEPEARPARGGGRVGSVHSIRRLRLTAHVVRRPLSETAIHGLGLVDLCADFIAQALPLLDYGWGVLERLRRRGR